MEVAAPAPGEALHPTPGALRDVLGQDRALGVLRAAVGAGRVHHAWIFHGPPGVGKFTTALAWARELLTPADEGRRGPVRGLIDAGLHPDLHVVTKELARFSDDPSVRQRKLTTIPKDVIETHLLRPASLAPALGGAGQGAPAGKVFVVDEAELLDRSATNAPVQNAILKTLEEPAPGTVIILVTSSEERLLATIRSRCQRVGFGRLDERAMAAWLGRSGLEVGGEERAWLLGFGDGSPGLVLAAARGGLFGWWRRLEPMLGGAARGELSPELGATMASLVDEWAEARASESEQASKDAANRAGARLMFQVLGEWARRRLREGDLGAVGAVSAIADGEDLMDANVSLATVFDWLAARLCGSGLVESWDAAGA